MKFAHQMDWRQSLKKLDGIENWCPGDRDWIMLQSFGVDNGNKMVQIVKMKNSMNGDEELEDSNK
jgi:hypothetical protein